MFKIEKRRIKRLKIESIFEDLKIGEIFISMDDKLDQEGLYMKIHVFDFNVYPPKGTARVLNLLSGNAFRINPDIKVRKLKNNWDLNKKRYDAEMHEKGE